MIIYFIRHSKPDYSEFKDTDPIFFADYAGLSKEGINIVENFDTNLINDAEIIIASPYTRTMQTAAILSKKTRINIITDYNLHEWLPDKTFKSQTKDFQKYNKRYYSNPENKEDVFETESEVRKRITDCVDKYKNKYDKIIIVAHQRLIQTYTNKKLDYCELLKIEV